MVVIIPFLCELGLRPLHPTEVSLPARVSARQQLDPLQQDVVTQPSPWGRAARGGGCTEHRVSTSEKTPVTRLRVNLEDALSTPPATNRGAVVPGAGGARGLGPRLSGDPTGRASSVLFPRASRPPPRDVCCHRASPHPSSLLALSPARFSQGLVLVETGSFRGHRAPGGPSRSRTA